jgi:phage FluMu protein Com
MTIRCAWCGKLLGFKAPLNNNKISHGICPACADKIDSEAYVSRQDAGPSR